MRPALSALTIPALAVALLATSFTAHAVAQDPPPELAADWVPFEGSFAVGCTRTSPNNPGCPVHHPTWAADFALPSGTRIRAAGPGVVFGVYRGCAPNGGDGECNGGAGNIVVIEHGDYWSRYLHLSEIPKRIRVGRDVAAGDVIGRSGASGTFGGVHLHYDEYQPGPPAGRVAFGRMFACHADTPVLYPDVLGHASWDEVPPGTMIRNDGYDCSGHARQPHPPAPEPPIYPEGAPLGLGGSRAVAVADLDGDGRGNLAVGSPGGRSRSGRRSGLVEVLDPLTATAGVALVQGDTMAGLGESGDRVGAAVSSGDFDCDGRSDLAVGAPGEDLDGVFVDAGAVNVVYGDGDEQLLFAGQGIDAYYRRPSDWLGAALAVGDFNGDDCDDLAIAAPGADRSGGLDMGLVWVLRGSTTGLRRPYRLLQGVNFGGVLESGDQTGYSLAAGDFNCDGFDDVAAGVPREVVDDRTTGAVMVAYGKRSGFKRGEALYQGNGLAGDSANRERTGLALAAGDLDADGCDDLAVGAPGTRVDGRKNAGSTFVTFGAPSGLRRSTRQLELTAANGLPLRPHRGDRVGTALAIADLTCDGRADLAIGVPGRDVKGKKNAGAVFVVRGTRRGLSSQPTVLRQGRGLKGRLHPHARVGSGLSAGRVDGNRCHDLVVSAPGTTVAGLDRAGAVFVAFGARKTRTPRQPVRLDQRAANGAAPTLKGVFGGASPAELFKKALLD